MTPVGRGTGDSTLSQSYGQLFGVVKSYDSCSIVDVTPSTECILAEKEALKGPSWFQMLVIVEGCQNTSQFRMVSTGSVHVSVMTGEGKVDFAGRQQQ